MTLYLLGLFAIFSWLCIWFHTRFPVHLFQIAFALGLGDRAFWPKEETVRYWQRHEWETWLALRFGKPWWAPLSELLTCPGCMGTHLTAWVSVGFLFVDWQLAVASALTWPGLLRLLFKHAGHE